MNKPQYLAELSRLLVFMTASDREQTIARCGELFDRAGPDGADDLVARIGSPTRVSIGLSRTYEPGRIDFRFLQAQADAVVSAPPAAPVPSGPASGPEAPEVVAGLPDLDVPPLVMDDLSDFELPPQPDAVRDDVPSPAPVRSAPARPEAQAPRFTSHPLDREDEPEAEQPKQPVVIERAMPLWAGVPLFIVSLFVLALPLGLLGLIVLPVLLAPGLALLLGAWLAAVGGLWCISYIADAVMLFGLAFLILGVALIVLWCGLRLDAAIVTGYTRGCRGVAHLTLGKKVTADA